nr:uncharacterized protein LOC125981132 [Syngnathus scovelli]
MALLHFKSLKATLSSLDLFSPPLTQLSIEDSSYVEFQPLSAIVDQDPIEFFIPGDGSKYLDLSDTLLHLRLKVTRRDGTNIPPQEQVSIVNFPINTIFSQLDISLGGRLISQSSAPHAYRSIIELLLNFSNDSLESQFTARMFAKDTRGRMDSIAVEGAEINLGFLRRAQQIARSREFHLTGPLHGDIFFSERHLLNNVDLRLKLTRASDDFCLMSAPDSDSCLKILGTSLFLKKVTVSPAVAIGHAATLQKGNARYPLSQINMKTFSIPQNSRICHQDNLFLGHIPKQIVIALVNLNSFMGRRDLNPFIFLFFLLFSI